MDTQVIELIGRNRLVDELLAAGLEVSIPLRDRGVDLIAYIDLSASVSKFMAVPIQMKAASARMFSLDQKYKKISNLLLTYVWGLKSPEHAKTYALTYEEALGIAQEMGWTNTPSWRAGKYTNNQPGKKICSLLEPHEMTSESWRAKILNLGTKNPAITSNTQFSPEALHHLLAKYSGNRLIRSTAYEDGGLDPLWPRLERAILNQMEGRDATISRYAIWANTVRDNIIEAMEFYRKGDAERARELLIRSANSLSAFSEVQHHFDQHKIGEK